MARLPGDQFAVLFSGSGPKRDITRFTDGLRLTIAKPVVVNQQEIFMTACLGAASFREGGSTAEQLMKDAAIALYEAKRRGKEMVEFFKSSMRDNRGELVALEAELRRAVERNEIEVHYQPIARLSDMDLAGFEALMRWRHPVLGLLAPESFLGLAEQTGMIKEIGRFVLNEATRQLGIGNGLHRVEPVFMAVNVSATSSWMRIWWTTSRPRHARNRLPAHSEIEVDLNPPVMQYPEKSASLLNLASNGVWPGFATIRNRLFIPVKLAPFAFRYMKVDRTFIGA